MKRFSAPFLFLSSSNFSLACVQTSTLYSSIKCTCSKNTLLSVGRSFLPPNPESRSSLILLMLKAYRGLLKLQVTLLELPYTFLRFCFSKFAAGAPSCLLFFSDSLCPSIFDFFPECRCPSLRSTGFNCPREGCFLQRYWSARPPFNYPFQYLGPFNDLFLNF